MVVDCTLTHHNRTTHRMFHRTFRHMSTGLLPIFRTVPSGLRCGSCAGIDALSSAVCRPVSREPRLHLPCPPSSGLASSQLHVRSGLAVEHARAQHVSSAVMPLLRRSPSLSRSVVYQEVAPHSGPLSVESAKGSTEAVHHAHMRASLLFRNAHGCVQLARLTQPAMHCRCCQIKH